MKSRVALVLRVTCLLVCCTQLSSAQTLTVNKYQFQGDSTTAGNVNTCISTNLQSSSANPLGAGCPAQISSTNPATVGSPVLYVIAITNSSTSPGPWTLSDTLPTGLHLISISCSPTASCPLPSSLTPSTLGPFTVPTGGWVFFFITGYFTKPANGNNQVYPVNGAPCAAIASTPCANTNLTISGSQLAVDLGVTKAAAQTTTKLKSNDGGNLSSATVNYSVTVKNNGPGDVFLGGIVELQDTFTNSYPFVISYTLSNFHCTPVVPVTICPDVLPTTALNGYLYVSNSANTPVGIASYSNSQGHLLNGQSFTITFDAVFDSLSGCVAGQGTISNRASIDYSTSHQAISDTSSANNSSLPSSADVILDMTGLPQCPTAVGVQKIQTIPLPGTAVAWGTPVTYEITVNNPSAATATGVVVIDGVYKTASTPAFDATIMAGPTCVACSFSSAASYSPHVSSSNIPSALFMVTIASIPANSSAKIRYSVKYVAPCETDAGPDQIVNQANANAGPYSLVTTDMSELNICQLKVCKMIGADMNPSPSVQDCLNASQTPQQVVFGGPPVEFTIFYQNLSLTQLTVDTVRDTLSVSSSLYGSFPINVAGTCSVLPGGGTVAPLPTVTTGATVSFQNPVWAGVKLIDSALPVTFGPNSTLMCKVKVTAPNPPSPASTWCQGVGSPQLQNSAFMDPSQGSFNDPTQPLIFDKQPADLPLCRNVLVNKAANATQWGPGQTVIFTIKVTNAGKDPVSGFTLTDPLPAGFVFGSATCTATFTATPCSPAPTGSGNVVVAPIPNIPAGGEVDIQVSVTASSTGGTYQNVATGSFQPGGNWYFGGDPTTSLVGNAEVQVLTPTLTKSFKPATVPVGSNSTLTFIITNSAGNPAQTGISFVDTLPSGLTFTGSPVVSCNTITPTVPVSGSSLSVTNGGLATGVPTCTITIQVTANGSACGKLTNGPTNITQTNNIDPTGISAPTPPTLNVTGCNTDNSGLTINKVVTGVTTGYTGTFVFNVVCATPNGPLQQQVSITLPNTSVTVPNVPAGSTCSVQEGVLPAPPPGYDWSGLPQYSLPNGVVQVVAGGNNAITVTNTAQKCPDKGQITITKKLEGVPPNFTGTFTFNIACTSATGLVTQTATITLPTTTVTVTGLPSGAVCTVSEAGLPNLPPGWQWLAPTYVPATGVVNLTDNNCCSTVEVDNTAKYCCQPTTPTGGGTTGDAQGSPAKPPVPPKKP